MTDTQNIEVVKQGYEAFGKGDIQTLLSYMGDAVEWQPAVGVNANVPTSGLRKGRAGVADFFKAIGESYDFHRFEPREFIAQGDKVVVLGHYTATVKSTGKAVDSEWVMIFTVADGKIVGFKEFSDSAQIDRAFSN